MLNIYPYFPVLAVPRFVFVAFDSDSARPLFRARDRDQGRRHTFNNRTRRSTTTSSNHDKVTATHPTFVLKERTEKPTTPLQRQSQVTKMVHDDVIEGQSQDREGRDAARAREANEDV